MVIVCCGWVGETQEQPYSLDLSMEACRRAVENLSPLHCSSTDLSPETICYSGCTLEKFIQTNGILKRGGEKKEVSKSLRFAELAIACWVEF